MMSLAPTEQFSPNVNVLIQPYQGSMADFLVLSRKQFKEMNLTIVRDETVGAAHVFEYKGTMMNRQLHWYARMQASRGFVYLATATAQETQWKDVSDRLKTCVDSLKTE